VVQEAEEACGLDVLPDGLLLVTLTLLDADFRKHMPQYIEDRFLTALRNPS
jgi:hypothetical protein